MRSFSTLSFFIINTLATYYYDHITTPIDGQFTLYGGDRLYSQTQDTYLQMKTTGLCVLKITESGDRIWDSNTDIDGSYLLIKKNGNMKIKDSNNTLWETGTSGNIDTKPHSLVVYNQCVYLINSQLTVLWSAGPQCSAIYPLGTFVPTMSPTISPTTAPTVSPTKSPTVASEAPSQEPSQNPTKPSLNPTSIPTLTPSKHPTSSPNTMIPTYSPSKDPTSHPTAMIPTLRPTAYEERTKTSIESTESGTEPIETPDRNYNDNHNDPNETNSDDNLLIGVAVFISMLIVLSAVCVFVVCREKKKKKKEENMSSLQFIKNIRNENDLDAIGINLEAHQELDETRKHSVELEEVHDGPIIPNAKQPDVGVRSEHSEEVEGIEGPVFEGITLGGSESFIIDGDSDTEQTPRQTKK